MRILLVDDYRPFAASVKWMLQPDHDVVLAQAGAEALTLLGTDDRFDLLLVDLQMPGFSGLEFWQTLRRTHPHLAACTVLMTGGALPPEAEEEHFASLRTLPKPFTAQQLGALLRDAGGASRA